MTFGPLQRTKAQTLSCFNAQRLFLFVLPNHIYVLRLTQRLWRIFLLRDQSRIQERQMSSGIGIARCGNSGVSYMVPLLSLPPSSFSVHASLSFNGFIKGKGLVLDYLAPYNNNNNNNNKNNGYRRRRGHGIVASSDVASPSVWDDWKPLKGSSTPSLSDILWPSAGLTPSLYIFILLLLFIFCVYYSFGSGN